MGMGRTLADIEIGSNGVATLWFAGAAGSNAWNRDLERAYYEALTELDDRPDVRAIVVTGRGRHFCPGASPDTLDAIMENGLQLEHRLSPTHLLTLNTPTIAAVNGGCAGMGLLQALLCDVRFVTPSTKLSTAFARRGLAGEHGITWLLPRLVGLTDAMELLLSGRVVGGEEAVELRLASHLVADDELVSAAQDYASDLANRTSPVSTAFIRHQLWADLDKSLEAALPATWRAMERALRTGHLEEGVASLRDRRPAVFADLQGDLDVADATSHRVPHWPRPGRAGAAVNGESR